MTRHILLQWEQGAWRIVGYPQMRYPNMFDSRDAALEAAWGLYEGREEEQVRRLKVRGRPRGWRLPTVLKVVSIKVPPPPFKDTLPRGYRK